MKAVLKEETPQGLTKLSKMIEGQWAIVEEGEDKGHIVYRPSSSVVYAVDLTDSLIWGSLTEDCERVVRILPAGTTIEIQK